MRINQKPTEKELEMLEGLGFELARDGATYKKHIRCPVEGYLYTSIRRYLLDSEGLIIGSYNVEDL